MLQEMHQYRGNSLSTDTQLEDHVMNQTSPSPAMNQVNSSRNLAEVVNANDVQASHVPRVNMLLTAASLLPQQYVSSPTPPPSNSGSVNTTTQDSSASGDYFGSESKRPLSPLAEQDSPAKYNKIVLPGIDSLFGPATPPSRNSSDPGAKFGSGSNMFPVTPILSPSSLPTMRSPVQLPSIKHLENNESDNMGMQRLKQWETDHNTQVNMQTTRMPPPHSNTNEMQAGLAPRVAVPPQNYYYGQQYARHTPQPSGELYAFQNYYPAYSGYSHPAPYGYDTSYNQSQGPRADFTHDSGYMRLYQMKEAVGVSDAEDFASRSCVYQPIISESRNIKRRTKTGCLTCRKRRIKCDETHPTCKNCDKSRRICLAYDPIFQFSFGQGRRKSTSDDSIQEPDSRADSEDGYEDEKDRMKINALLEAATSIDEQWTWSKLYDKYLEHTSVQLDGMFGCNRFQQIKPVIEGRKKGSSHMPHKQADGEDMAVLEAIRQMMSMLMPSWAVDSLKIDKMSVKMEEMRITDDYKILRAIVQLISSYPNIVYLDVSCSDAKLLTRVMMLHELIHGEKHKTRHLNGIKLESDQSETKTNLQYTTVDEAWTLIQSISDGCKLSEEEINSVLDNVEAKQECPQLKYVEIPVLMSMLYYCRCFNLSETWIKVKQRLDKRRELDCFNKKLKHMIITTNHMSSTLYS